MLTQLLLGLYIIRSSLQDRRLIMQQLEQALEAQYVHQKQKGGIHLGLTMEDRLLLGHAFTFTSNKSMPESAAKIVELITRQQAEDLWSGTVKQVGNNPPAFTFNLNLSRAAFRHYGMVDSAFQTHIRGIIEQDAVPGTSSVVGVAVSGAMIWVYIGGAFMLLLQQWWLRDGQQNIMAVCCYSWALLFSLSILGTVLNDRHYAARILERSLQAK